MNFWRVPSILQLFFRHSLFYVLFSSISEDLIPLLEREYFTL